VIAFGASSLKILRPRLGIDTWLRRRRPDGRVPILNYVNRARVPGRYSVRVTTARDFRGGQRTYDGHLGTDFAVPIGTTVVAAAPGVVVHVASHATSGGLKVCIDHGAGLLTTSNHLSRALVRPGDLVRRGAPVGLSGASGLELALFFPWLPPHLHFNVWLGGEPVDPFARAGEVSLWHGGNDPVAATPGPEDDAHPSVLDEDALDDAVAAARDPRDRRRLLSLEPIERRACALLLLRNYRPERFSRAPQIYPDVPARTPRLDLPFSDFIGVAHPS
jgi:murein DD-endopeptidase